MKIFFTCIALCIVLLSVASAEAPARPASNLMERSTFRDLGTIETINLKGPEPSADRAVRAGARLLPHAPVEPHA
jgi:hypothetical protein